MHIFMETKSLSRMSTFQTFNVTESKVIISLFVLVEFSLCTQLFRTFFILDGFLTPDLRCLVYFCCLDTNT